MTTPGPNGETEQLDFRLRVNKRGQIEVLVEGDYPDQVLSIVAIWATDRTAPDGTPMVHMSMDIRALPVKLTR